MSTIGLRPVEEGDRELLWTWANLPDVRAVSFSFDPIPWEEHCDWFRSKLADTRCRFFIVTSEDRPVGQVRFDLDGENAVISISLDPAARGKGFGSEAIRRAVRMMEREPAVRTIHALIKNDNQPSLRAFTQAGFQRQADAGPAAHLVFRNHESA